MLCSALFAASPRAMFASHNDPPFFQRDITSRTLHTLSHNKGGCSMIIRGSFFALLFSKPSAR